MATGWNGTDGRKHFSCVSQPCSVLHSRCLVLECVLCGVVPAGLVILHASQQSVGSYTCRVTNLVGSVESRPSCTLLNDCFSASTLTECMLCPQRSVWRIPRPSLCRSPNRSTPTSASRSSWRSSCPELLCPTCRCVSPCAGYCSQSDPTVCLRAVATERRGPSRSNQQHAQHLVHVRSWFRCSLSSLPLCVCVCVRVQE